MVCEEDKAEGELFTVERKRRWFIVWFGDKLIFSNQALLPLPSFLPAIHIRSFISVPS